MLLYIGHMLPYMGSPMILSHLTWSYLEKSMSLSLRFRRRISRKGAALGHMLLLNTNVGNRMHASHTCNVDPGIALKGQGREVILKWYILSKRRRMSVDFYYGKKCLPFIIRTSFVKQTPKSMNLLLKHSDMT